MSELEEIGLTTKARAYEIARASGLSEKDAVQIVDVLEKHCLERRGRWIEAKMVREGFGALTDDEKDWFRGFLRDMVGEEKIAKVRALIARDLKEAP